MVTHGYKLNFHGGHLQRLFKADCVGEISNNHDGEVVVAIVALFSFSALHLVPATHTIKFSIWFAGNLLSKWDDMIVCWRV
jgi:hypothetical protein